VDQRDLVERARDGDHDAFAVLAGAAVARLDAAARLILRDRELARDVIQDAMMRAWRDLPGLRDPDKFDAWLRRLTVHACIDAARHRRRRPIEVELTVLDAPSIPYASSTVVDRDTLDRALRALDPEWRAVVGCRFGRLALLLRGFEPLEEDSGKPHSPFASRFGDRAAGRVHFLIRAPTKKAVVRFHAPLPVNETPSR